MRRFALLLTLLLVLGPGGGARGEQGRPRLDAQLRLMARGMLSPPSVPVSNAAATEGGRVRVAVEIAGGAARLRALGFAARPAIDSPAVELAWLEARPEEIAVLAALPGLRGLERAPLLHTTLDKSVPACGAAAARQSLGLDGRGAYVGVVDTGVDFRHRDFRDGDGATRIAALLDVSTARGALHRELPDYAGGALWLAEDLDAQLRADEAGSTPAAPVVEIDRDGHGSHVAGIAVSSGHATGKDRPSGIYVGVAPGARLVAVRATRQGNTFQLEDVLAGIRFVFDTATRDKRPAVVNLSLGGDSGPHDGTSAFERAIAALAPDDTPGRCVVVSAGNGGARDRHAGGLVVPDHLEVPLTFPQSAKAEDRLSLELWFDGAPPAVSLRSPSGQTVGPVTSGLVLDRSAGSEGRVRIDVASGGRDPHNGRWNAGIVVTGENAAAVASGHWTLILDGAGGAGAGRWDAWIVDASGATADPRFLDHLDPDVRGDYPAFAASAISVGSFVSRNVWRTLDGRAIYRSTVVGRASTFSGTGPTADGRFFPDLAAPGDYVLSALSSSAPADAPGSAFYVAGDPTLLVTDDGVHGALRGTSQAAPHVAGAIALLYQIDPTLTPRRLRELLRASAVVEDGEAGWSPRWGFGRLDVARAAALLRRDAPGALDLARSTLGVSRDAVGPGERLLVSVVPRDGRGAPLGPGHVVDITCDGGRFDGPTRDGGEGRWERTLIAEAPRGSRLTVGALVDGRAIDARSTVWVVRDRQDVGHPFVAAGGGCAIGPRSPAPATLAGIAAAMTLLSLRARQRRGRASRKPSGR